MTHDQERSTAAAARLACAIDAARLGGGITTRFFQSRRLSIDTKADGTPVTEADRASEHAIREHIALNFTDDGILGEEYGSADGTSGYRWIIDPIDGTFSFMNGVPFYTTLIGVESRDADGSWSVEAGVIYAPALDEMVYARNGAGTWHIARDADAVRARVSTNASIAEATVSTTSLDYWDDVNSPIWLRMASATAHTRGWPDAYGALLTATGRCDAIVEPKVSAWDIAPFFPILQEAGGRATCWAGEVTAHRGNNICSNGLIHDDLLALVST